MKASAHKLPDGHVAPFPRQRFEEFLKAQKIQSRDSGLIDFYMLGSQRYLLDEIEAAFAKGITSIIILKARGGGISTILLLLDIFWASEYEGTLGAFITHEEAARDQFRAQIDVTQLMMPKKFKVQTKKNSRLILIFKNTSLIRYLIAGTKQTTNKLGRSGHSNFIHASEVAFWGSPDDIKALRQAISKLHPHRGYFFESTANGYNHFEEMWQQAKDSPAQHAVFIGWWRDERNEFDADHPLYLSYMPQGVRTPLSALERRRVRRVKELYGFEITAGQIAWYRNHLEDECGGDQATMDQENPWTEEDAFVSTGATFFSDESLTGQMREAKRHLMQPFTFRTTNHVEEIELLRAPVDRSQLKIWEKPSRWGWYFLGHDPSFGTGRDDGAISVMRGYADACIQVAEFSSNALAPHQQAWVLAFLCGLYRGEGGAMPIIELQTCGRAVLKELEDCREKFRTLPVTPETDPDLHNCLGNMRHFLYRRIDTLGGQLAKHWQSTHDLKDSLLSSYRGWIETGTVEIRSLSCLEQMRRTVEEEGTVGAAGAFKDDKVIASALACYAWDQWGRSGLKAKGYTVAHSIDIEKQGGEDPIDGLVRRFLSRQKIVLRQDQAQ